MTALAETATPAHARKRVLIVDDSFIIRNRTRT